MLTKAQLSKYMSQIGQKGGKKSRRSLSREESQRMLRIREARRAYRKHYSRCFWSFDPHYLPGENDIPWIAEQLKKHGNRKLWLLGKKLCP